MVGSATEIVGGFPPYLLAGGGNSMPTRSHGHTSKNKPSRTYITWQNMKQRCLNPKNTNYYKYGKRGIGICSKWLDFHNFLVDMGERPSGKSLDRINNNGNYGPGNCRWATQKEQMGNIRKGLIGKYKRKNARFYSKVISKWITKDGHKHTVIGWAAEGRKDGNRLRKYFATESGAQIFVEQFK